jgi:hypothetical protein
MTLSLPADGRAVLILPEPLTPESLLRLEQGLADTVAELRHEMSASATAPGEREYASWMQQLRPSRP